MNWRSAMTLLAIGVFFAPATHAKWYISVFAGLNDVDDTTLVTDLGTIDTTYDSGIALSFSVGYDFGNRFRLEGEILSDRVNDVDLHQLGGVELPRSIGGLEHEAGILNVFADFRREARVSPYVGVGAGVAELTLDEYGYDGLDPVTAEKNALTYQAIAGLAVAQAEDWSLQFDARYVSGEDPELDLGGTTSELSYSAFSLTAGVRYTF